MSIVDDLLNCIFPKRRPKTTKKADVPKSHPIPLKSLFVVGDEFVGYHQNVDVKSFAKWMKEEHEAWYSENKTNLLVVFRLNFNDLIEYLYANKQDELCVSLMQYLVKWYALEHGMFHFSNSDRRFFNLTQSHILQVLYKVNDEEVLYVDNNTDIAEVLDNTFAYVNNWFVGVGSSDISNTIVSYLSEHGNYQIIHFKLISNNLDGYSSIEAILKNAGITNYMKLNFGSITTIPADEATKARFKRWDRFNTFADRANVIFRHELSKDDKSKRFDDTYLLSVVSNREHPKNDHTHVIVFWGSRPFAVTYSGSGFNHTVEQGAQMVFYRMEDGYVSVTLYPAKTDHRKPIEDAIVLQSHLDPTKLLDAKTIHRFWKCFVAYMEETSLDGNPTIHQACLLKYLHYFRHYIVNNEFQPVKTIEWVKHFIEFIFTVGCSGFVVFLIQCYMSAKNPDTSVSDNTDRVIKHVDSTQNEVIKAIEEQTLTISHDSSLIKNFGKEPKLQKYHGK